MKVLIEQYLSEKGINEDFKIQFLRYTTKLYKTEQGKYKLEFLKWCFPCPKPIFTSEEIENAYKLELIEAKTDGINSKYTGVEREEKLNELNSLTTIEEIENY